MANPAEIPIKATTRWPVDELHFDPMNPRRGPEWATGELSEEQVIKELYETADLGELLQSISTSGYVDIEPLVVLLEDGRLIVLEGNRRLAALKALKDPHKAAAARITIPELAPGVKASLEQVSVYRVESRESARDFIGFKHINGPHAWDSLAKARFAAQWYRDERARGNLDITLQDISRRMGDRHDTIKRMVAGIFVLDQAEEVGAFHLDDRWPGRGFAFSHLYTALTRPGYREYLGLAEDWRGDAPELNPIPETHFDQLQRVLRWLYGSKSDHVEPLVKSQNPHVKQLGEVLLREKSRLILENTNRLEIAYQEIDTVAVRFERQLVDAHTSLKGASSALASVKNVDEATYQVSAEILDWSTMIEGWLKSKRSSPSDG